MSKQIELSKAGYNNYLHKLWFPAWRLDRNAAKTINMLLGSGKRAEPEFTPLPPNRVEALPFPARQVYDLLARGMRPAQAQKQLGLRGDTFHGRLKTLSRHKAYKFGTQVPKQALANRHDDIIVLLESQPTDEVDAVLCELQALVSRLGFTKRVTHMRQVVGYRTARPVYMPQLTIWAFDQHGWKVLDVRINEGKFQLFLGDPRDEIFTRMLLNTSIEMPGSLEQVEAAITKHVAGALPL